MYDITNYASFDDLTDWLEAVKKVVGKDGRKVHMGLVGNKGGCGCCDAELHDGKIFLQLILNTRGLSERRDMPSFARTTSSPGIEA